MVPEFCFLEQDPGPCSQLETRWAYDARAGACAAFQYGGCGGNQNNFPSEEYCQHYCVNVQGKPLQCCYTSQMIALRFILNKTNFF